MNRTRRHALPHLDPGYREYRPGPALARLVDCFWTLRARASTDDPCDHRVLPDGRTDLVFQLGAQPGVAEQGPPGAYVVGPMVAHLNVRYEGPADVLGVRFLPGAARTWVDAPAHTLRDLTVDLDEFWRNVPGLIDELGSARADADRVECLERQLLARHRPGTQADAAAMALEKSGGLIAVNRLARAAGASERQLQRRFRDNVGYPPRTARRIARFMRASRMLTVAPGTPWSELVVTCGFHDQSHLIREFRAFAGVTPVEFAAGRVGSVQDAGAAAVHIGANRTGRTA